MIRRTFLKTLIAGAGASLIDPTLVTADPIAKREPAAEPGARKVVIGGAGITGLCCGYELMKAGIDVTILEASGRYSGHVLTSSDELSDGLYADLGADHITRPGYERLFAYAEEFKIPVIPYPNAEGSWLPYNNDDLRMIGGKFYTNKMLANPETLASLGFNHREVEFLSKHPWYELQDLYLQPYVAKVADPYRPFGAGLDDLDKISITEVYKREGASQAAINYLGDEHTSALYCIWRVAAMKSRGIPPSEGEIFRLRGGNEQLPVAFARRLGSRVKLAHPIIGIQQRDKGISVNYREYGYEETRTLEADYFVNCISLTVFRNIPVSPPLSPAKQYVVDNLTYTSHPFYVFEASSKFWLEDGLPSINMEFDHPDIDSIWEVPSEVETTRVILKANGPGGLSPQRVLAAFRQVYPGKRDTIVQALTKDWTQDKLAPSCEMEPFPIGEMHQFWPEILKPEGRIYFAGTYADLLSRGMESCIRSAQRVAQEIREA
ncbi:MAG TPA: NAD(P)/FAD-dependent oxidoreductase [Acidobacteriaceae bacterium]|jgi:monoamine oxidase|nr:NAD(P)/FAD-dependent oxidoreductase [Acidobacteriaceae bacterium]